ncbi:hypothetical protein FHU33_4209 [Blastococcus colisei]|uniref:GH26 domain-containing protein n=1 Tax=Blastococcus colisei TaxID=1564162 RepID=A0A543P0C9_9ACTN|nr:hypothetical protein [Blastococcus colisei]TQN37554.1 hypothetical protein FHU33_4209 [Blastococcus colisei]
MAGDSVERMGATGRQRSRPRASRRLVLPAAVLVCALVGTAWWWEGRERYAVDCLAVGAHVDDLGRDDRLETFREVDRLMGPLTMRRSFDPALPPSFAESDAAGDAVAGLHSFVSWKPPDGDHAGAAQGRYDDEIAAWARSVPRTGVYATAYHEPENDMTAAEFVALQRHLYRVVKDANETIRWGPVYMSYWWDPAEPSHYVGDPQAWWPGAEFADFAGLDWYGADPRPMTTSPNFLHWYEAMRPTGEPMVIPEYGQYVLPEAERPDQARQRARAEAIRADAAWIAEHPEIRVWLYWQDTGHQGDWAMTDEGSQRAWAAAALAGCRP